MRACALWQFSVVVGGKWGDGLGLGGGMVWALKLVY